MRTMRPVKSGDGQTSRMAHGDIAAQPRWLPYLGIFGLILFVVTVVVLHFVQPDLNPLDEAVSYYVHGAHGWLLTVGLLGLVAGSLALTWAVGPAIHGPGVRIGQCSLAIWSAGVLLGGMFRADPRGTWNEPPSLAGLIHGNAALVAFIALAVAAVLLARSVRRDARWRRLAGTVAGLAAAVVISLIAFFVSLAPVFLRPGPPILLGLTERILLAVYIAWLAVMACGVLQAAAISRR